MRSALHLLALVAFAVGCSSDHTGPSGPSGDPPPPPDDDPVITLSCDGLGLELGSATMTIDAGQARIDLPTRANTVAINTARTLDQVNTEYILGQDITVPGTAFEITASDITLNLNSHTVTYGTADSPAGDSYGVYVHSNNLRGIVIANGRIEQGGGPCTGTESGIGCNPIFVGSGVDEIAGLHLAWHTDDTSGIVCNYIPAEIHHNTLMDGGTVVSNRDQGVPSIRTGRTAARVHHNLLRGVRHRAIDIGPGGEASYNEIHLDSRHTNSYGVFVFVVDGFSMHHNKVYGVGTNPIGFGMIGDAAQGPVRNGEVYSNYVEVENTRDSDEYSSSIGSSCLRTTWGADAVEVMCNQFKLIGGNAHPELTLGHPWWGDKSWGRALWVGLVDAAHTMQIHHNLIETTNADGQTYVPAIAVLYGLQGGNMVVQENLIRTNNVAVSLSDHYGGSSGYPKFVRNRFERIGTDATYRTVASFYRDRNATAVLVDNVFGPGTELAAGNVDLLFCGTGIAEVFVATIGNGIYVNQSAFTDVQATVEAGTSTVPLGTCGFEVTF